MHSYNKLSRPQHRPRQPQHYMASARADIYDVDYAGVTVAITTHLEE